MESQGLWLPLRSSFLLCSTASSRSDPIPLNSLLGSGLDMEGFVSAEWHPSSLSPMSALWHILSSGQQLLTELRLSGAEGQNL